MLQKNHVDALQHDNSPWCVILAARVTAHSTSTDGLADANGLSTASRLVDRAIRRALSIVNTQRIIAIINATSPELKVTADALGLLPHQIVVEPLHRGTGYEILHALIAIETLVGARSPVIFLSVDNSVKEERGVTNALISLVHFLIGVKRSVCLIGAQPEGPHNQLGYVVPWCNTWLTPGNVYDFVEMPDEVGARELISAGALWNTFMFGGTVSSLLELFNPHYQGQVAAHRQTVAYSARECSSEGVSTLSRHLLSCQPIDFSRDILAKNIHKLNVLRLPPCGWRPLKAPQIEHC